MTKLREEIISIVQAEPGVDKLSDKEMFRLINELERCLCLPRDMEGIEVCSDWMHEERRKEIGDNFCPLCGTDLRPLSTNNN